MRSPLLRASIAVRIAGALLVLEWVLRVLMGVPFLPISTPPYVGLAGYVFGEVLRMMAHVRRLRTPPDVPGKIDGTDAADE